MQPVRGRYGRHVAGLRRLADLRARARRQHSGRDVRITAAYVARERELKEAAAIHRREHLREAAEKRRASRVGAEKV